MKLRGQRNDGSDRLLLIHLEGGAPVSLYNNMYVSVFFSKVRCSSRRPPAAGPQAAAAAASS